MLFRSRKKNIGAEDKATVERWIDDMEKLRAQNEAAAVAPKPQPTLTQAEQPLETKPAESLGPDLAPKPKETENKPQGIDLTDKSREKDTAQTGSPFYKKWWFWTGVGVVAAGAVATILIAGRSNGPCSAANLTCLEAK